MTGHPGEWYKKTLTTTLRFLLTENLVVHQNEFWFMDNQVSAWANEVKNLIVLIYNSQEDKI